jgi:hypothetical protein
MRTAPQPPPGSENSSTGGISPSDSSISAASSTCDPKSLPDGLNATSSPASADGARRFALQDGPKTDPSGRGLVLASHSAAPVSAKGSPTNGISGPSSTASSRSISLQSCLESRLRARMGSHGSMEYSLTWKCRITPALRPICALRAQARKWPDGSKLMVIVSPSTPALPISGSGFTGWPSPMAGSPGTENYNPGGNTDSSRRTVALVGWSTPKASDCSGGRTTETKGGGNKHLDREVRLVGWCSPTAQDGTRGSLPARPQDKGVPLSQQVQLVGWSTPRATDGSNGGPNQAGGALPADAGRTSESSTAQTGKRAALNPDHSRWLMGFRVVWGSCGATAMASCLLSRRSLSKQRRKLISTVL